MIEVELVSMGPRANCPSFPPLLAALWSDGGPQFISKVLKDSTKYWGFLHKVSSPRNPSSNSKAEATIKSMKKLIHASWTGRSLDHDKLCRIILQYRNTLVEKMACHPHKNCLATRFKISCQPITSHSYLSGNAQCPQPSNSNKIPCNHPLPITTLMHTHYQT